MDVVRILQCPNLNCANPVELAVLSGVYTTPQIVISNTGFMRLMFNSDSSVTALGFSALWSSVSSCFVCVLWIMSSAAFVRECVLYVFPRVILPFGGL